MRRVTVIIFLLTCLLTANAQDADRLTQAYNEAENAYAIGRLEEAHEILTTNLSNFKGSLLEGAYRLLALCSLAMDDRPQAEDYTRRLLSENPYYSTTYSDPQRFIDMVSSIKSGMAATITTASSQAENLNEVPVPTTLITEEMIRISGGRNLQEVLAAYVPGMNIVDNNDDINIAMRGVYNKGQEKILIMLNGHRLNSYCTNTASPDFSISLEKVKQIEVLRGPASSLYGGVALTAVVNIITKQGADIDGIRLKAGLGNYGQQRADVLFGKRYFDLDLLVWGSLYHADGQKFFVPIEETGLQKNGGDVIVGGIGDKPSFDAGMTLKWNSLQMMYDTHMSQIISPYTASFAFSPYNIDAYKTYNGIKPSFMTKSHHLDVSYSHQFDRLFLKGAIAYDMSDLAHYQVISDSAVGQSGLAIGLPAQITQMFAAANGISRYINGQESTISAQLKGDYQYINNSNHKGLISFGADYNHFKLDDVRYLVAMNFGETALETSEIPRLGKGSENSYDLFVQMKHQWKDLIFNAGLRYDHKTRYDESTVNELSPRLAAIYLQPKWNVKLSYSKSFVDAPYLYRKTNLFLATLNNTAATTLSPESLHSLQLTFAGVEWFRGFNFEVNGFYNRASNLIYTSIIENANTGTMQTIGAEVMASYEQKRFQSHLNVEWQKTLESEIYGVDFDEAMNIPTLTANLVLGWKPIDRLNLNAHVKFEGRQKAYSIDLQQAVTVTNPKDAINIIPVSQRAIFNLGASYDFGIVEIGLNCHNLLNHHYRQSGMGTGLIPQRGRWFMATVSLKL